MLVRPSTRFLHSVTFSKKLRGSTSTCITCSLTLKQHDSIIRPNLFNAMNELEMPKKLICMIRMTKMISAGRIQNDTSTPFETYRRLRRADVSVLQYSHTKSFSRYQFKHQGNYINQSSDKMGLHMNQSKTKFMPTITRTRTGNTDVDLTHNDHSFEADREFIYLGKDRPQQHLRRNKKRHCISKHLSIKARLKNRLRLYNTLIVPVLTYG